MEFVLLRVAAYRLAIWRCPAPVLEWRSRPAGRPYRPMSSPAGAPAPHRRFHRRTLVKWGLTLLALAAMGAWMYFKGDELQAKLSDEWAKSNLSFSQFG